MRGDRAHPAAFRSAAFWRGYYPRVPAVGPREFGELAELDGHEVDLLVAPSLGVRLCLDQRNSEHTLLLIHPRSGATSQLGWSDRGAFRGDVFRWSELRDLCARIEAFDPTWRGPVRPLVLLAEFAPIAAGDQIEGCRAELARALAALGVLDPEACADLARRVVAPREDLRWIRRGPDWVLAGEGAAGIRHPLAHAMGDAAFPFSGLRDLFAGG